MHVFVPNAHIVWQSSFRKQSLASPRSSRKSAGRSICIPSAVISPPIDSCWGSPFLDYPFLMQKISHTEFGVSEKQCQNFATLVPDAIISCSNLLKKDVDTFVGVILFADISGFTSFCEEHEALRLGQGQGKESADSSMSKMTAALNGHLGAMVQLVYSSGGDVVKFSGDAILALWKLNSNQFIYEVIHQVISCALLIQRKLSDQVDLRVKLAISAGNLSFGVIGTERTRHYVLVGTPIQDLKAADRLCESGQVVLSPSAWNHCRAHNYHHEMCGENYVKVMQILYSPISQKLQIPNSQTQYSSPGTSESTQDLREADRFRGKIFRKSMAERLNTDLAARLQPFMIPPVVQQIEANQPLEYLTEMRQVTTMFINLIPSETDNDKKLIKLVDDVYCTVSRLVARALGCLTKVSLFDKDVMLLAVFGLRGFKYEQESRRSLRCGCNVKQAVSQIPGVRLVSVGITTGMAYCGVVGHTLRREYTVIGAHVNKAAKMMCAYPGLVSCERTTRLQSNLPAHLFTLLEAKPIKGIDDVGPVYEYSEDVGHFASRIFTEDVFPPPLLGREELIGGVECLFRSVGGRENYRQVQLQAVVLQGEAGVGKTRVLRELGCRAESWGLRTSTVSLQPRHGTAPYAAVQHACRQIMAQNSLSVEELVLQLDKRSPEPLSSEDISLLNFTFNESHLELTLSSVRARLAELLSSLTRLIYSPVMMAVDDLHLLDDHSWQLCVDMLQLQRGAPFVPALVLATYSPRDSCIPRSQLQLLLAHPAVSLITLSPLPAQFLGPLACQLLSSHAVQQDLVDILEENGRGNPGWCANYLDAVIQTESVQIQPRTLRAMLEQDFVAPDPQLLATISPFYQAGGSEHDEDSDQIGEVKKCAVVVNQHDCEEKAALYVNDVIVSSFDSLSPYEQLVLKCASVVAYPLGGLFTRAMLLFLMHSVHEGNEERTTKSIELLFEMGLFECAVKDFTTEQSSYTSHDEVCTKEMARKMRNGREVEEPPAASPSCAANCRLLRFQTAAVQKAIYELLPGNQKRSFHLLAVEHLERSLQGPIACPACRACAAGPPGSSEPQAERRTHTRWYSHLFFKSHKLDVDNIGMDVRVKDCYCPRLIVDTLSELIDHCSAVALKKKQLYYMTEYGFTSILSGDPLEAIGMLSDAQESLRVMLLHNYDSSNRNSRRNRHEKSALVALLGRALTLTAQAYLSMGELDRAQLNLSQAMDKLEVTWPQSNLMKRIRMPRCIECAGIAEQRLEQAACLALLSDLYSATGSYDSSRDAALASLKLALLSEHTPSLNKEQVNIHLCAALSCVLESSVLCQDLKQTSRIERPALRCVHQYLSMRSSYHSLTGRFFARLLCAVFVKRLFEGKLRAAQDAGVVVLRASEQLNAWRATTSVLPLLIQTFMMHGNVSEALSKLQLLKDVSERLIEDHNSSIVSLADYHILRLDILLDVGEPNDHNAQQNVVEEASAFAQMLLQTQKDDTSDQSIIVRLWVWFARRDDVRAASSWLGLLGQAIHKLMGWSGLRHLEALLISYASQPELQLPGRSLLARLQSQAESTPMYLPRLLHLRAYYTRLRGGPMHLSLSMHYLTTATNLASKQGNTLEYEWCQYSRKVWMEEIGEQENRRYYPLLVPQNRTEQ